MALRQDIDAYMNVAFDVAGAADYGPNGLQVEGRSEIRRRVCGVSASVELIIARQSMPVPTHGSCVTACSGAPAERFGLEHRFVDFPNPA